MPYTHMGESSEVVEVKKSKLKKAGKGLFAKKKIKKGEFICWYAGVYVNKDTVHNGYYDSDYLWEFEDSDLVIDAADPLSCLGRYVNDSLSLGLTNANVIDYDNVHAGAIMATKAIAKGTEIYITYGPEFWTEERRFNKLNKDDKQFVEDASG